MDNKYENEEMGILKISDDVIATIAKTAVLEVEGVVSLSSTIAKDIRGIINPGSATKGIDVRREKNDELVINIGITVKYGNIKITDIARSVQENVERGINSMTGMKINAINVTVLGITFKEADAETLPQSDAKSDDKLEDNTME